MSCSNLSSRRVFIVGDNSLFEEGIAQLLAFGTDLSVSNTKYTDDPAFLDTIAQNQPDVILLNESTSQNTAAILKLLFSIPSLVGLRVIIVRLSDNIVDVYEMPKQAVARNETERQQFNITNPDELMSVVRGEFQQEVS